MEKYWPHLPFIIPTTEGTQMWWDISWWIFQIVVMTVLIVTLTKWALKMDKQEDQQEDLSVESNRVVNQDSGTHVGM